MKQSQAIALKKERQVKAHVTITEAHHILQKPGMLSGQSRVYTPNTDGDPVLPPEFTRVQQSATDLLAEVEKQLVQYFDSTATVEYGNCTTRADLTLPDGTVLLKAVPVTYLLFLEKQLVDLHTLIVKLPSLDPSVNWSYDQTRGLYVSEVVTTFRTEKKPQNHVKAPATQQHPAQVDVYYQDVPIGKWETVRFSSALPASRIKELLTRVDTLKEAVKLAREEANHTVVPEQHVGDAVLGWLFA